MAELGWTDRELARKAGVGNATVSRAVNLEAWPRKEQLERIARALSVDVPTLLTGNATERLVANVPLDGVVLAARVPIIGPIPARRS